MAWVLAMWDVVIPLLAVIGAVRCARLALDFARGGLVRVGRALASLDRTTPTMDAIQAVTTRGRKRT